MRRDTRWRASPPGFCAFPDSVRSRLFSPFSRYLHIILHTAVFADRSRTRESLSASTYTGTRACVGGGQHVPSICSEGFGRPVSIFPSRFSFIGCRLRTGEWKTTREPLARKQFQTLEERNAAEKTGAVYFSSGKRKFQRFVPSLPLNPNSHGDSVIDTSGCEVKCIVEIFSGEGGEIRVIVREIVLGFFIGFSPLLAPVLLYLDV